MLTWPIEPGENDNDIQAKEHIDLNKYLEARSRDPHTTDPKYAMSLYHKRYATYWFHGLDRRLDKVGNPVSPRYWD